MVRNHNLAKAISDCGWGMFTTTLKYKAEREGKTYIEIDRWFPSTKTCNNCLNVVDSLPLDIRYWDCQHCGTTNIDRDINAAKNIRDEALRILRCDPGRFQRPKERAPRKSLGISDTAKVANVRQPGKTSVLLDAIPGEVGSTDLSVSGSG